MNVIGHDNKRVQLIVALTAIRLQCFQEKLRIGCNLKNSSSSGSNTGHEIRSRPGYAARYCHPDILDLHELWMKIRRPSESIETTRLHPNSHKAVAHHKKNRTSAAEAAFPCQVYGTGEPVPFRSIRTGQVGNRKYRASG